MEKLEKLIPGQFYHIYNRGNNKENIFVDHENYIYFLKQYKKYVFPIAETYAYCLLKNHFHILLQIKEERELDKKIHTDLNKLSQPFSNFFNSYAKSINNKYDRTGSLFEERFKRKVITTDNYFKVMVYYIHSNPQKHRLINDYRSYPYGSYNSILSKKKTMLEREKLFKMFGGREGFIDFHTSMSSIRDIEIDNFGW